MVLRQTTHEPSYTHPSGRVCRPVGVFRGHRAGASGYLNKHLAARCLIEAIRQGVRGGQYLNPKMRSCSQPG